MRKLIARIFLFAAGFLIGYGGLYLQHRAQKLVLSEQLHEAMRERNFADDIHTKTKKIIANNEALGQTAFRAGAVTAARLIWNKEAIITNYQQAQDESWKWAQVFLTNK